jgi:hypothetical protein
MPNTSQNCVSITAKVVCRRFQVPPPKSNEKPVFSKSKTKQNFQFFVKDYQSRGIPEHLVRNSM